MGNKTKNAKLIKEFQAEILTILDEALEKTEQVLTILLKFRKLGVNDDVMSDFIDKYTKKNFPNLVETDKKLDELNGLV